MKKRDSKTVVFDMDGTLIKELSWRVVHNSLGVDNTENFQAFENGEIDSEEFSERDIELWRKKLGRTPHINEIEQALCSIKPRPRTYELIQGLREKGYKNVGIISSGIDLLADKLARILHLNFAIANGFKLDKQGYIKKPISRVNLLNKGEILGELIEEFNLSPKNCVAVGDSKFDVEMLKTAGRGIAFAPRDGEIEEIADVVVRSEEIIELLEYF